MSYFFFLLAIAIAVVDWVAVARGWRRVEYAAKPAVMLALLAWLAANGGFNGPLLWFACGLALSLAGDVFLMLPRERFLAGLACFLLAHLAYLVGFNPTPPPLGIASLSLALVVALPAIQVYRRLAGALHAQSELKTPVALYFAAISLMLFSALLTLVRAEWPAGPALLVSGGALLFVVSDISLAWDKFVAPLRHGHLLVILTYHLGQALITLGAAIHFLAT
jgi:uncharacterized membrane protein YhhN